MFLGVLPAQPERRAPSPPAGGDDMDDLMKQIDNP
jgi:hypothetical protein